MVTLVIGVLAGVIVTVIDSPGDSEFDKGERLIIRLEHFFLCVR